LTHFLFRQCEVAAIQSWHNTSTAVSDVTGTSARLVSTRRTGLLSGGAGSRYANPWVRPPNTGNRIPKKTVVLTIVFTYFGNSQVFPRKGPWRPSVLAALDWFRAASLDHIMLVDDAVDANLAEGERLEAHANLGLSATSVSARSRQTARAWDELH